MPATILDGKATAGAIRAELAAQVVALTAAEQAVALEALTS